jgi:transposase
MLYRRTNSSLRYHSRRVRFVAWQQAGVWQRIHETLLAELRRRSEIDLLRALVDSSSIRAILAGKKVRIPRTSASAAATTT